MKATEVTITPNRFINIKRFGTLRQYRHTIKRAFRVYDACQRLGMRWSLKNGCTHFVIR